MAILKRRNKRKPHQSLKEYIWPTQGWKRTAYYYKHRLFRGGDSTYRIAGGIAMGGAISFTPFIGTHFVQAFLFAWLFRMNGLAALLGTALGNPVTFPFLFGTSYVTGAWIMRVTGLDAVIPLSDDTGFKALLEELVTFFDYIFSNPGAAFQSLMAGGEVAQTMGRILPPFAIGGYFAGAIFWVIAYGILYYPVYFLRRIYHKQRLLQGYHRQVKAKKKREAEEKQ